MKRFGFQVLIGAWLLLMGMALGIRLYENLTVTHWDVVAPDRLFSADVPLDMPSLSDITAGSTSDAEALKKIVDYADVNQGLLTHLFQESDPWRAKALWVMYEIHTGHWFGPRDRQATTLLQYLRTRYSDCGDTAKWQVALLSAFNLPARVIDISGGTHVFVETWLGDHWEIFDATVNVWIDTDHETLMRGGNRAARSFFTPMNSPEAATQVTRSNLKVFQELRLSMPLLGLAWTPKAVLFVD